MQGTGYYLVHNTYSPQSIITLLDIEPTPLSVTKSRLQKSHPNLGVYSHQHDILSTEPIPPPPSASTYDSISLTYLLHTLPVPATEKILVFEKTKAALKPSGVVFGATILGRGSYHTAAGRMLLRVLNWEKRLSNYDDEPEIFIKALKANFQAVRYDIIGSILVFEAREPR
jgi:hypothetical protein